MAKFNDFDLDLTEKAAVKNNDVSAQITSKSLCTLGCITGVLQGCNLKSLACNVAIGNKK